jgi:hypothetical protein
MSSMLTAAAPVQDLLAALLAATKAQQSAPIASRITTLSAPITSVAPEKRGRGRPKLSDEEKAARKAQREASKLTSTSSSSSSSSVFADAPLIASKPSLQKPAPVSSLVVPTVAGLIVPPAPIAAAPEKRGRGRPKLSDEEKLARKLAREASRKEAGETTEKRGRGRPKLSEEEKAARKVARQEAKIAALRKEFERLAKKLVRAEAKLHKDDEFEDARAKPTDAEDDSEEDDSEEDDSEEDDSEGEDA